MRYGMSLVSRHRLPIYGVAALWLLLLHMETQIPAHGPLAVLSVLQRFGSCGVEIFCLMSGFGLYHSLKRGSSIWSFYKKRAARVLLPAFLVMAPYLTLRAVPPAQALPLATFFPYWWGADTVWYVPFIMTMYLAYPLLFRLQQKSRRALALVCALSAACVIGGALAGVLPEHLDRSLHRIPVFLLGCVLAPWVEEDRPLSRAWLWGTIAAAGAALAGLFYLRHIGYAYSYWLRTCFYTVMAAGAIFLTALISECLGRLGGFGRAVYKCLAFMGMISLECYLLFTRVKDLLGLWLPADAADRVLLIDLGSLLFTILGGFLLVRLCASLRACFQSLPAPSPEKAEGDHAEQPRA